MMGLLRRLFRPRRQIFQFDAGDGTRYVDPIAAWYTLETACQPETPTDLMRIVAAPIPAVDPTSVNSQTMVRQFQERQKAAAQTLALAACEAFGVKPMPTTAAKKINGLSVVERLGLVADLARYLGESAALAVPFVDGSPLMDASRPADLTPASNADSGLVPTVSDASEPTPQP